MHKHTCLLLTSVFFSALLPVSAWGYGFSDYPGDRGYRPYAESAGGYHLQGSMRLQKRMTEDGYYIRARVQGLRPEDVQVYVRRNRLVLQIAEGDRYRRYGPDFNSRSRLQMRVRKQLRLPYDADWTRMTTSTNNGTIEIFIPRRSQHLPAEPSPGE